MSTTVVSSIGVTPSERSCFSPLRDSDGGNARSTRSRRLDEEDARGACVHRAVLAVQDVLAELGDLPGHLDAGRAGADDDERQPRGTCGVVFVLGLGGLEREQDAVAQVERAVERLQLRCVRRPVVVPEVRVARSACDDERVVVEHQRGAVRQVRHGDTASVQVEPVDVPEQHARVALAAQDLPQRHRHLDGRERAGRDLVGERLEEVEVLAVDERHVDVRAAQAAHGEQAAEAAADDHHTLPRRSSLLRVEAGAASRRARLRTR